MTSKNANRNKGQPYVGVTDFTSRDQVIEAKKFLAPRSIHRLHVGAMTSYKVQNGIKTFTGWENIWLNEEGLKKLFSDDDDVFNVIHYADYDNPPLTTSLDLHEAIRRSGPYLHGLQLDMVWPEVKIVKEIKSQHPSIEIILQIGKDAVKELDNSLEKVLEKALNYLDCVDYFLIDFSMGKGEPLNPEVTLEYLRMFTKVIPIEKIAIGGGLGPETTHLLKPIVEVFPRISWDAQGQMRKPKSQTTPIEMPRVISYVYESSMLAYESLQAKNQQ